MYRHKHPVNVSPVITGKIELFKGIAADKHIGITTEIGENLYTSIAAPALDLILGIILDNAIKYNIPQGSIHINLKGDGKTVKLIIRNTGPGMPSEQCKQIFRQLKKDTNYEKNIPGTDAGLPLVKSILDDARGNIAIASKLDKETIVTITFKRHITKEEKVYRFTEQMELSGQMNELPYKLKPVTHDQEKATLLVLEKDLELLSFMQENMEEDFNFYYIRNFSKIRQELKKFPKPDAVIINMTDRDYSISESVQEIWNQEDILFIFYTVKAEKRELLKGLRYGGAVDYIDKPCSIKVLSSKILSILRFRKISIIREVLRMKDALFKAMKPGKKDDGTYKNRTSLYNLTEREKQVVRYVIMNMDNKEIAEKTGMSENSVTRHIKNIQEKCGLQTRYQIIEFFTG